MAGTHGHCAGCSACLPRAPLLGDSPILSQDGFRIEPIALVVLVGLAPIALCRGHGPGRPAIRGRRGPGLVAWFVICYPNLSGLPLPSTIVNAYQGLLPTYLYAFQFPVNTDPAVPVHLIAPMKSSALTCPVRRCSSSRCW